MRRAMIATILCLFVGFVSAAAQIPDPDNSTFESATDEPVSIMLCPACDGHPFDQARLYGGGTTDATILVTLRTAAGLPVPGYPREDIWLECPGLCSCDPHFYADADTDINGQTVYLNPLCGGGCCTEGPVIYAGGQPIDQPPLANIRFNSPDINCDLVVNLADVVYFASGFFGAYDYCYDFYWDGVLNLSDVVVLAQHLGHACQ